MKSVIEAVKRAVAITIVILLVGGLIVGAVVGGLFLLGPLIGDLASAVIIVVTVTFLIILAVELQ